MSLVLRSLSVPQTRVLRFLCSWALRQRAALQTLAHQRRHHPSATVTMNATDHSTRPIDVASDTHSTTFDEKPSQQPSVSSDSVRSNHDRVANQDQEKGEHVTDEDEALEPVVSRHPSVRDASSIPNGGLWAWLQVLGGFFLLFNSWYVTIFCQSLRPN